MSTNLQSVVIAKDSSGQWIASHIPSGKKTMGHTPEEANEGMRLLLGLSQDGSFAEPPTSPQFDGLSKAIALFLEGPITQSLSFHAGWARLTSFNDGLAKIKLGGGCQGCPSSQITLFNGVKDQLQSRFSDSVVLDVVLDP